jgi:xylose isomerase
MKTRKYSVILGNLGNTCDRFCRSYKNNPPALEMLRAAAAIPHVSGIELVGTWDIRPDNAADMKRALSDLGIACVSIIPDVFSRPEFGRGAYSNPDPKCRQLAMDETRRMCDIALELGCGMLNLWPGQDGYDYLFAADYDRERDLECGAIRELATAYPTLRFALEYKPKEPRTRCYMARMADTILMARETGRDNVGVTMDTGHAFVAGENPAEAVVLARRAGNRLFHMHFNDNHASWDDDMIVGTVHSVVFLELLYWLDRCGYDGWLSMDQYPYREDAAGAIGESIQWLVKFDSILQANRAKLDEIVALGDPVQTSKTLRGLL